MASKIYLLSLLCFTLIGFVLAQENHSCLIHGTVRDSSSGEILIGVNVILKSSGKGTVTDGYGKYSIPVSVNDSILQFSYIGFQSREIPIVPCEISILDVNLRLTVAPIGEVQITAQRKFFGNMEYGREIPSIDADVIERQNVNNASDILHARLAGVWATKTSGAPGDHQKIRIRGQNSFFSSAEPLYIVDGVPVPIVNLSSLGIADLNIHDIENVTVLKDASSTALYGFQGGNGVVLIDTKRGGTNEISFSVKTGVQWFNQYYDLLSAAEQIEALDSAYSKMLFSAHIYYPQITDTLCNRDWQDFIFSPGQIQEYQLSGSGSFKRFKYYLSGNYTDHKGITPQSAYERYTFTARLGKNFGRRLAVDLGYRGSYQLNRNNQDEYHGNRMIFESIMKSPCMECTPDSLFYDKFYNLYFRCLQYYTPARNLELPQEIIENNRHELSIHNHAFNGFARYQFSEHFSMDIMESLMIRSSLYNAAFDYYYFNYQNISKLKRVDMQSSEDVILFNHQVNMNYYNTFGKHDLNFVLANRYYKDNLWWRVDTIEGTLDKHYALKNSMAAYGPKGSVLRNLTSYIGHASYNYDKRYFISAILNLSRIKEGIHTDYYTVFPSVAVSWDMARERFFPHALRMDNLKWFINWGKSGNYPLNGLSNDLYVDLPLENDGFPQYYPSIHQLSNHALKHENTSEIDMGLKSVWYNNRLKFSAGYFHKTISDLILQRNIPLYYGGGKMFINIAEIVAKGYEFSLEGSPLQTKNTFWLLSFNFATSSQIVTRLDREKSMLFRNADLLIPDFMIKEGQGVGDIYGYRYLGKWTEEDWEHPDRFVNVMQSKFLNTDSSDHMLTQSDKVVLGNSLPDFTWNISSYFSYKNLSVEMIWYSAWGQEKYNATRAGTYIGAVNRETVGYINDSTWALRSDVFYESDLFVEDASFIKLKNISFNYSIAKKIAGRLKVSFSLSFENMVTLTRYKGYDPEATIFTDNNFSDNAIDKGAYPNPRAIYASINLKF
ncbi:MAG: SusC/RagA family TonB-linked outer membrane protein [Bacteroidales bacterium]|nr:SusC/RagA family TonB-linked outer membrane protein [Bacteroidales bacterium]MBN2762264.1 SusC/RagA family TonB-linked outer membrane protein [Bacteroidales bacterium]